jgi:hypothetical protein
MIDGLSGNLGLLYNKIMILCRLSGGAGQWNQGYDAVVTQLMWGMAH